MRAGQAGRNPLPVALKCFGFDARGKRFCQPRRDYIGLTGSGRRCLDTHEHDTEALNWGADSQET